MTVKFGDVKFTIVRIDADTIRLVAEQKADQRIGNLHQVIITKGTPDEAEALKNALEKADSRGEGE